MADYISNPLLALIKEQGLIDDLQLEEVMQEQTRSGKTISQILHDFGIVELETQLQIDGRHIWARKWLISRTGNCRRKSSQLIPAATARMYQCVPVADLRLDAAGRVGRSAESGDHR